MYPVLKKLHNSIYKGKLKKLNKALMNYNKLKFIKNIENSFFDRRHFKHKAYIKSISKPIKILDVTGYIKNYQDDSYTYLYNVITHIEKIGCKCIDSDQKIISDTITGILVGFDNKGEKNQYIELISNQWRFKEDLMLDVSEEINDIGIERYDMIFFVILLQKGILFKKLSTNEIFVLEREKIYEMYKNEIDYKELDTKWISENLRVIKKSELIEINNSIEKCNEITKNQMEKGIFDQNEYKKIMTIDED